MGDYHLFPQARVSEVAKYANLPLPQPPKHHRSEACFTQQRSESTESLLHVKLPSPGLCNPDEIQQIWNRASQHSTFSNTTSSRLKGLTRADSLASVEYVSSYREHSFSGTDQTLLPPAIVYRYSDIPSEGVPCRLSSSSSEVFDDASNTDLRRGANPDLLQQLSNDLEALSLTNKNSAAEASTNSSTAPSTPPASFASPSQSGSPIYQSSSLSSTQSSLLLSMEECTPLIDRRHRPTPLAIPPQNYGRLPYAETKYESCRPPPLIPCARITPPITPTQEVSHIDWDDDEDARGKLARVKKSFGDLRAAAMRTKPEQHTATPRVPEKGTTQYPLSPKSLKIEKTDIKIERPARPAAPRAATAPTATQLTHTLYGAPPTPPPNQPLPPRPVTRPAFSATDTRQSLPPLPIRTTSHAGNIPTSPPNVPRIIKKPSTRLAPSGNTYHNLANNPRPQQARRRAISDGPNRPTLNSPALHCPAPPVPAKKATTAATPTSTPSQRSSTDIDVSTGDETAPAVSVSKQRAASLGQAGAGAGSGSGAGRAKRRVSVLSVSSRGAAKGKVRRGSAPAATGGGGLMRIKRWFRWGSKCTPPVTA